MHRGKKRKLLAPSIAEAAVNMHIDGVPITRIIKNLNLELSPPTLKQLLQVYLACKATNDMTMTCRVFPGWIDNACTGVQESPDGWTYDGFFPLTGSWVCL